MATEAEQNRYLFVVGDNGNNEWIFDDFLTGYTKAREVGKTFRRLRIRADGSVSQMILWQPSQAATVQYTSVLDQISSVVLLGQGSGM